MGLAELARAGRRFGEIVGIAARRAEVPIDPTWGELAAFAATHGPDMLVILDPTWQVRYVSDAAEKILEMSPGGRSAHLLHYVHPADAASIISALDALGGASDYHAPVSVRIRTGRDDWMICEVASNAMDGPGGTWMVLSVRQVEERDDLADRQAILRQLIHFSSVEFARTRWYDVDEVSQHLLRSLCGVFGASVVEIAWSDEDEGPLTLEACWSAQPDDGWTPNRLCAPGTLFEEINTPGPVVKSGAWSCDDLESLEPTEGAKRFIDAGLDSVVELRLSPDRPRAVLRLGFANGLGSWDEINTEPVSLLGLLVLSSLRRCRLEAALSERARRDSLTGVLNRGEFYQQLELCIASAHQVGRVGVLYCDVDHFKVTNDNHGHAAGDEVLRAVADAVRVSVREGDEVARVGGDEFVALCRGLESPAQLEAVKQRVADRLSGLEFAGGSVSLSIGSAVLAEGQDADALVGAADAAMYRAKFQHRTRPESGQVGDRVIKDAE